MTPSDDRLIGHPLVALAERLGCTEGQLYTMVTAVVIAIVLGVSSVHGGSSPDSTTPIVPSTVAPASPSAP
jgi:hypothetical protein